MTYHYKGWDLELDQDGQVYAYEPKYLTRITQATVAEAKDLIDVYERAERPTVIALADPEPRADAVKRLRAVGNLGLAGLLCEGLR